MHCWTATTALFPQFTLPWESAKEGLVGETKWPSTEDHREEEYAALRLPGPHYSRVVRQTQCIKPALRNWNCLQSNSGFMWVLKATDDANIIGLHTVAVWLIQYCWTVSHNDKFVVVVVFYLCYSNDTKYQSVGKIFSYIIWQIKDKQK